MRGARVHWIARACVAFLRAVGALAGLGLGGIATISNPALAAPDGPVQPQYGWREMWLGADAMRDVWLLYTGITLAPWSEDMNQPGWRLRTQAGYGRYDYEIKDAGGTRAYQGEVNYTDAFVGYQWRLGALTAKAFAGVSSIDRQGKRTSRDHNHIFSRETGPKAVLELWFDINETQWTSLNVSYTSAHDAANARWRWGVRVTPEIAIGPELRFDSSDFRNQQRGALFDEYLGRAGLFLVYKAGGLEVSAAGGVATTFNGFARDDNGEGLSYYAGTNVLFQY